MSDTMTVWYLKTDEFTFVADTLVDVWGIIYEEITGRTCCLGDKLEFSVEQGEMTRHEFDNLKEFEG